MRPYCVWERSKHSSINREPDGITEEKTDDCRNKIFSLGIENLDTLNEFLEELNGDLDIPGFDEEILKQMVADADEVTEKISEYGTLDEEEIQQIKEANEKREQKELEFASEEEKAIAQTYLPQQGGQSATMESQESAETRRFVICPKCGEQIWL